MATLEVLNIQYCSELDGAMMEKILKLQNCYHVDILRSRNLLEKWEQMQGEAEHPFVPVVYSGGSKDSVERGREWATRVALLHGKCVEVNENGQLMERSSLLVGLELEEGISAMVALIMLPIHFQSQEHRTLQPFVEIARRRAEKNGSARLQIVCARGVELDAERPTPTEEEERAEQQGIRQILLSLPKGSCAIPSSESKRIKVLAFSCGRYGYKPHKLWFVTANVVDIEGRKRFENLEFKEHEISSVVTEPPPGEMPPPPEIRKQENEHCGRIDSIVSSIIISTFSRYSKGDGRGVVEEFMKVLKSNEIHHLPFHNNTSKVDDLRGKEIGVIICEFKFLECINLQQFYKNLQQMDSNFIGIWIPIAWPKKYGNGTYTRLLQCMPWVTFPHPQLLKLMWYGSKDPCFVLLDKHGQIAKHNALSMLLACGAKSYTFTHHTIPESFSLMESESCLEFLLHGMNIVGRRPMKFLYSQHPPECREREERWSEDHKRQRRKTELQWVKMKSKLEELTQIQGSFEVLYVGRFPDDDEVPYSMEYLEQDYEAATQNMRCPSLSFWDMIMFWYRCKHFSGYELNEQSNIMMHTLHALAKQLYEGPIPLVVVDNDGVVTRHGYDVVQMICESSEGDGMAMRMVKDEVMKSLSAGECSPLVKTFFRDDIDDHPLHRQHRLTASSIFSRYRVWKNEVCDVCSKTIGDNGGRLYSCQECDWDMCGSCWREYAKQKLEQLLSKGD